MINSAAYAGGIAARMPGVSQIARPHAVSQHSDGGFMRSILLFVTLGLCALSASLCFAQEKVYWGIEYWSENVSGGSRHDYDDGKPNIIYVLKVDLKAKGIRAFVTPDLNGGTQTTSQFLSNYGVQVAINTAFFQMGGSNRSIGYFSSNGVPYTSNVADDSYPTIGFTQANEFLKGIANRPKMYNALSGIYDLVVDGNAQIYANYDVAPRTVAGIDKTGRYFYMIVNDGRYSGSAGMTLSQIGKHMARLGVWYGINLDGGGSSTMVIASKGVVNRPSDGAQRYVASHLGFFASTGCSPSPETCNGVDDNCDNGIDENGVCNAAQDPMYQSMIYDNQNTDVDGDGKADICARGVAGVYCALSKSGSLTDYKLVLELSDAAGWNEVSRYGTIRFADYNGDGLADICARDGAGVKCWVSKGDGFGDASATVPMSDADGYNDVKYYSTIRFADIDGDGRDDMCARFKDGLKCYPARDNAWGNPVELGDMGDQVGWGEPQYYTTIRTGDINGDGKVDICGRGGAGFRCWISEGDKFAPDFLAAPWSNGNGWSDPVYYQSIRMADFNGDHLMDVCARDSNGLICYPSKGTSMGEMVKGPGIANVHGWHDYDNYSTMRTGDFNGDGREDFCVRGNANLACYMVQDDGGFSVKNIEEFKNENGWTEPNQFRTIRMGDVNGDGKMDICGRNADGVRCYAYNGTGFDVIDGPQLSNALGWGAVQYYSTLRIGGPVPKACARFPEVCDQKDNNCNGQIDEGNVCCQPSEEICDNQDNDCDGEIDEGLDCCQPSTEICDNQDNDCDGEIDEELDCCQPSEEICDNQDNDCDGLIDEDLDGCCDIANASEEICDGRDNDCDGEIDEGLDCCQPSTEICDNQDNDCDGENDEDLDCCQPSTEICDNQDNDCDGEIDEDGVCGSNNEGGNDSNKESDAVRIYTEDDCGCSLKESRSAPNPLIGLLLLGGLIWWRRRRNVE